MLSVAASFAFSMNIFKQTNEQGRVSNINNIKLSKKRTGKFRVTLPPFAG
jgi:hypothetical protein